MSCRSTLVSFALVALACPAALAQTEAPAERAFNLKRTSAADTVQAAAEAEAKPAFVPRLVPGSIECSITLGYLDLASTMVSYPGRIIYKRTNEHTYYGDVVLQGESAFNPVLRLGYVLKPWLTVEGVGGISVSEYSSKISRTVRLSNEQGATEREYDVPLGEFDAEQRSCITINGGANLVLYPFDLGGGHEGRWHPFLLGGLGKTWYSLNSNYTEGSTSSWTYTGGGGIRFVADELVSVRLEVLYNRSKVKFDPAESFLSLEEGTLIIPLYELPDVGVATPVQEFEEHSLSSLSWALGFTAAF